MKAEKKYQADVVVIGGGIAGIVTALELLDRGRKVLILDRDGRERFGGQAITAFGGMMLVGTPLQKLLGVRDSADLAYSDWCATAGFGDDDDLPRQWARMYCERSCEDIYRWVRSRGIHFLPSIMWPERGYFRPGNSLPRYHIVWGTGQGLTGRLIRLLLDHPKKHDLALHFDHRVTGLVRSGGRIIGCSGADLAEGTDFSAEGDAVVIACGGIAGDIAKVKKIWPADMGRFPDDILIGSHPYCDGSGHEMAVRAGGVVANIGSMWNYPEGIDHPNPLFERQGLRILAPKSALWMDHTGRRIGPLPLVGYFDARYASQVICGLEKPYSWHIMNWKIAVKELALSGSEHNTVIRDRSIPGLVGTIFRGNPDLIRQMVSESRDFITAQSLPELVDKMNALTATPDVVLGNMERDIRLYDEQIGRGEKFHNDDQLRRIAHARMWPGDRMRTCRFRKILDPGALPLIAVRYRMLTRKSLGGIRTDLGSRVVAKNGKPVPGLYAVGEAAGFGGGGINGKSSLEGTFLSNCILTGRMAAGSICGAH